MPVTPGTRLGPYEILAKLGEGGMGEVYTARDTRLGRDVAIKVLPATFSSDPDRLQRFEHEARAAAALNHPNILALYDIGTADAAPFIVSERLEGQTLRECLDDGTLSLRKAVDYAVQIAHGLAAAHDRGIVHRDLKPENLFVTNDGRVKILDFGLAKLTERDSALSGVTAMPTTPAFDARSGRPEQGRGAPATQPGTVLGTAGYMAPEQVRGLTADHRADIFAFGAVLFEMLTGRRAFKGDTAMDTMTAILKEDPPDPATLSSQISPALTRIVHRCLEKNPAARFQGASDLAFAIEALSNRSGSESPVPAGAATAPPARARSVREMVAWGIAAAALAATAFLGWRLAGSETDVPAPRAQFTIASPPRSAFYLNNLVTPYPSPDGRMVAFVAQANGNSTLWVRDIDSLDSRPIAGNPLPGSVLFWSPDSRYLGFFTATDLKKVNVSRAGALAETVWSGVAALNGRTAAWGADDTIVFATSSGGGLSRVSANGGAVTPVTTLDASRQETSHRSPHFLPDGRDFLYQALPDLATFVGSLDGGTPKPLAVGAASKVLYSAGHLLYVRGETLLAQPFDASRVEMRGEAFPVANGIQATTPSGLAPFGASLNGVLAYRANLNLTYHFEWFDRTGRRLGQVGDDASWGQFSLSTDGRFAAAQRFEAGGAADLWLLDLARGVASRLTTDPGSESDPIWSPDSRFVAYTSRPKGVQNIFRRNVATGEETQLLESATPTFPEDWSRDNRWLVFVDRTNRSQRLSVLPLAPPGTPVVWLDDRFLKDEPHFSPDSRWIAFQSDESGQTDVYLAPFPGPGQKVRVSVAGGGAPQWRADGKELVYLTQDGTMMSVPITTTGATMAPGVPRVLFTTPIKAVQLSLDQYAISPDGERFLIQTASGDGSQTPITVVLNWTSGLGPSSVPAAR